MHLSTFDLLYDFLSNSGGTKGMHAYLPNSINCWIITQCNADLSEKVFRVINY